MQPLVVVSDGLPVHPAKALVAHAGWRFVDQVPPAPWDLTGSGLAIAATVPATRSVAEVVGAAARGVATVSSTIDPVTSTALVDDLARIGRVEQWSVNHRPRSADLTVEEVDLLCALAAGATLGDVAERLYLSRRTADRRLAGARDRLGVTTTAEALCIVGEVLGSWCPIGAY